MAVIVSETVSPENIISVAPKWPLEKAIEFDGVPTGSTNANEHAMVAGNISASGWTSACLAIVATMGMKMLAVTVLLHTLVTSMIMVMQISCKIQVGFP